MMKNEARVKAGTEWEQMIWSLASVLRGSASEPTAMADLIVGALFLALHFKEFEPARSIGPGWVELISSPLGGVREALRMCIRTVGGDSPALQKALEIMAGPSFDAIGDREIMEVLQMIQGFPIQADGETRNRIGAACMALWTSGKMNGAEHSSSLPLSKLMVELADPRAGDRIYDPFAGLGGTLIQAWRHAHSKHPTLGPEKELLLQGCEINRMTWARSKVLMGIFGIPAVLENGDAYALPSSKTMPTVVVSDPPLMVRRDFGPVNQLARRFFPGDVPPAVMDTFSSIYQLLANLDQGRGRAVVVAAPRALFGGGAVARARRTLLEQDVVEAVIALPKGMIPRSNIAISLLVLNLAKPAPRRGGVQLISAENLGMAKVLGENERFRLSLDLFEREAIPVVLNAYREWKNIPGVSVVANLEELADHDWDISPNRYLSTEPESLPKARIEDLAKTYGELHAQIVKAQNKFNEAVNEIIPFTRDRDR